MYFDQPRLVTQLLCNKIEEFLKPGRPFILLIEDEINDSKVLFIFVVADE